MFRLRYLGAAAALVLLAGCGMPMGYYGGYGNGYGTGAYPYGSTYGASPYGAAPYGAAPYGAVPYGMPYCYGGEVAAAPPAVINNQIPVPVPVDPGATTSTYGAYGNSYGTYGANGYYGDGYANRRHHRRHHGDNQTTDPTVPGTTTSETTTTTTDQTTSTVAATGRRGQFNGQGNFWNRVNNTSNSQTTGSTTAATGTTDSSGNQVTATGRTRGNSPWSTNANSQTTQQTGLSPRQGYNAQTASGAANPFGTRGQAVNQQSMYRQGTAMNRPTGSYGAGVRGRSMVSATPRTAGMTGMRTTQGAARTQSRGANQKRGQ